MNHLTDALFDTNILIEYLQGNRAAQACLDDCDELVISRITKLEILGWTHYEKDRAGLSDALAMLEIFRIEDIDPYADFAAQIRRNKGGKLPDVIIHATALALRLPIVTHNVGDFHDITIAGMTNIDVIDPY